ncbi:hypothetical protein [Amycolatopsis sp. NPDC051903]|uniref:hypothetical protein n=1 Tax=Amycolatopsis sp. NPDC051903 TaxID=3363936 RepID=UPI0037BA1CB2
MADGNPLVAQAKQDGDGPGPLTAGNGDYGYATGIGVAESAMDAFNGIKDGDWVSGGLGVLSLAGEVASAAIDPFGYLMSSVASFLMEHVQPLKDMLDSVAGNPPVIQSYADTWGNVAKALQDRQADYTNAVKTGTADWKGEAADAYRKGAAEAAEALGGAATVASAIGTVTMIMGQVVSFVRETVRQLIADLVGKLISWVMEEAFSLGFGTPVVVAQAVTAISKWGEKISGLLTKLCDTMRKVSPLLGKLADVFTKIIKILGKLAGKVTGLDVISTKNIKAGGFAHRTGGGSGGGGSHHGGSDGGDSEGGDGSHSGDSDPDSGSGDGDSASSSPDDGPSTRDGSGDSSRRSTDGDTPDGSGGDGSAHTGDSDGGGSSGGSSDGGSGGRSSDGGSGGRSSDGGSGGGGSAHSGGGSADGGSSVHSGGGSGGSSVHSAGGSSGGGSSAHSGGGSGSSSSGNDFSSHSGGGSSSSPSHTGDAPSSHTGDAPSGGSAPHTGGAPSGGGASSTSGGGSHSGGGSSSTSGGGSHSGGGGSSSTSGGGSPSTHSSGDSSTSASGYAPPRVDEPSANAPAARAGDGGAPSGSAAPNQPPPGGLPPAGGGAPNAAQGGVPSGGAPARPGSGGGWTGTPGSPGARTPDASGPRPDRTPASGRPGTDAPSRRPGDGPTGSNRSGDPNTRSPQPSNSPSTRSPEGAGEPNTRSPQVNGDPNTRSPKSNSDPNNRPPQGAGDSNPRTSQGSGEPETRTPQGNGDPNTRSPQSNGDPNNRPPQGAGEPNGRSPQGNGDPNTRSPQGNGDPNTRPAQSAGDPNARTSQGSGDPSTRSPQGAGEPNTRSPQGAGDPNGRAPQGAGEPGTRTPQGTGEPNTRSPQGNGEPATRTPQGSGDPAGPRRPGEGGSPSARSPQGADAPGPRRPGDAGDPAARGPQRPGGENGVPGPRRPGEVPEPAARGGAGTATRPDSPHRTPEGDAPHRGEPGDGTPHHGEADEHAPRNGEPEDGAPHRDDASEHHDPSEHHGDGHHDAPDQDGAPHHHDDEPLSPDEVNQHHSESTPSGSSYHRGDADMGDLPHRVQPDPDGRYTVDVHVTPDGHARIGDRHYTPEEFADVLRHNADYDGRPIRLIGCDAGSNDFAHRLSRELDTDVMAPNKPAWSDANGRVFSSDYEIGPDGRMHPRIPPDGEWSVHHPDGTSHHVGDDGFAPETHHHDPNDVDAESARHRGDEPPPDVDPDSTGTPHGQDTQQHHHEPEPDADPDVPKDHNPASRQQEHDLLDPQHQADLRAHPQDLTDFKPTSHGDPIDVGGPNHHGDGPNPPSPDQRWPGGQKLEPNREYRVHDSNGNPRGTYHTDENGRVSHIDTDHPNQQPRIGNKPNPDYHPNPDVTHPHPNTTYRVGIDGHHQTFTTDADGLPHPSFEYHRPDFDGDPVRIDAGDPHAPKGGESFASGGPYEPHRQYDVTDANGVHRGTFYTDANGDVRWAEVESGRVGRTNPDLPSPGNSHLPSDAKVTVHQKLDPDADAPHGVSDPDRFHGAQREDVKLPKDKPFVDSVPKHPAGHPHAGEPDLKPNHKYVVSSDFKDGTKTTTHPRTVVWTDEHGRIAAVETYRPHHPDLNNPAPNMAYDVDHGKFTYQTTGNADGSADTAGAHHHDPELADNKDLPRRDGQAQGDSNSQATVGKYDGGHIAGNQFKGPGELLNMLTQWRPHNQGWKGQAGTEMHWKAFETDLANHLKAGGKIGGIDIFPLRADGNRVPHTIQVRWVETDPAGNTSVHMRSFGNGPSGSS